ncbi:MAG: undecaprenyl/decaprenyl-phosphate alpha-N-acetylglucosaminyl 1-phosphate transferase [Spirochaetales bacterium]|nr:undecaprenyl/decaprenyl-phosphate alpha-N-acetylglucosaminyl 1-phosphate transferase [Spirochaetales bacterium]
MSLTAFLLNALLTPVILHFSHRFKWYDDHNSRKIHTEATPRIGGIGIFIAFVVASILGLFMLRDATAQWPPVPSILMLLAGLTLIHGLGVYDDFVNLPAIIKFLVQLLAGGLVALSGAVLRVIELPMVNVITLPEWLAVLTTVFWVVSIANAVNLIDGADGLAGGVSLFAALFMGLIAAGQGNIGTAIFAFALVGSLAGFLLFNFPPARIFMGDGGSLTLGYLLAVLPLLGLRGGEIGTAPIAIFPILTLLYVPIVDTILAIARRAIRGLPLHAADKEHIHHRLIDRGFYGRRLLAVVYSGMIILGFTAMAWFVVPPHMGTTITLTVWIVAFISIALIDGKMRRS